MRCYKRSIAQGSWYGVVNVKRCISRSARPPVERGAKELELGRSKLEKFKGVLRSTRVAQGIPPKGLLNSVILVLLCLGEKHGLSAVVEQSVNFILLQWLKKKYLKR